MKAAPVVRMLLAVAAGAGCASAPAEDSLLPGTIGVAVVRQNDALVVAAVRPGSAAASRVRVGDVVRSYNGVAVASEREFNRLVLDSSPGTRARLEVARDGALHSIELPVNEIDLEPAA
jgi:S1-C subfamily serine protease